MAEKTIKTGKLFRDITFSRADVDTDARTVELSFSSEEPYDRWWGTEILDHGRGAVRLDRLKAGGPLLLDHDTRQQIGVIESVLIADKKGRAVVRFSKSAKGEEIFQDVTDGIRQNVSVGYQIHKMRQEESDPDNPVYRATDWEPFEISLVSVPADTTVGVGRQQAGEDNHHTIIQLKEGVMPDSVKKTETQPAQPATPAAPAASAVDREAVEREVRALEQKRTAEIVAIGQKYNVMPEAQKAIADGSSVETFLRWVAMERNAGAKPVETSPELGMSDREARSFSLVRLINALANPQSRQAQEQAAMEIEACRAYSSQVRREVRGALVPPDVLRQVITPNMDAVRAMAAMTGRRDLTVGSDPGGGYLVGTNLLAGSFIEMLRNRMILEAAGASMLRDLVGDLAIPKQTGGATAYWLSEGTPPTESQQTLGQLQLTPHTVGAYTDYSRKLMLQSSLDVEAFVRADLARILAIALDLAGLHGTAADGQPRGVASTTGIGSVAGGENGAAPTWANIISLETEVATDNADLGALSYITNAKVRGKLKSTLKTATYGDIAVWETGSRPGVGEMNGYPAYVTNQVSSTLVKGSSSVCSAIFFGNWADLVIALWSGIDIQVNPYSLDTSGAVRVTAFQDADIGVRHAESFAAMLDALTA